MSNVLIASLGDSPVVVSSMYEILTKREMLTIDRIKILCPQIDKIAKSYLLIEDALQNHATKPIQNIEEISLDFEDANSRESCIKFLSTLYALLDKHQQDEDSVYLSLAKGIADIDDEKSCTIYQQTLEKVIEKAQQNNTKSEVIVSLTGGRKGMTAQTIFAAQNKEIDYVYHTLITDDELSERIDDETTIEKLQQNNIDKKERGERMFLRAYNYPADQSKFALFKVPIFHESWIKKHLTNNNNSEQLARQ